MAKETTGKAMEMVKVNTNRQLIFTGEFKTNPFFISVLQ